MIRAMRRRLCSRSWGWGRVEAPKRSWSRFELQTRARCDSRYGPKFSEPPNSFRPVRLNWSPKRASRRAVSVCAECTVHYNFTAGHFFRRFAVCSAEAESAARHAAAPRTPPVDRRHHKHFSSVLLSSPRWWPSPRTVLYTSVRKTYDCECSVGSGCGRDTDQIVRA